jgi:hypothetical protein
MGRRSLIPVSAINRLGASIRAAQRREETERLISRNMGKLTDMPPTHSIFAFDFNSENKIAHIDFLETKQYRTIERYVTQDYVRYPVYSGWKTKTKHIKKTIKLTNTALEELNKNEDSLIREFASEIVLRIHNSDLIPSWCAIQLLEEERDEKIKEKQDSFDDCKTKARYEIGLIKTQIRNNESKVSTELSLKKNVLKKRNKKIENLKHAKNKDYLIVKCIFTLCIILLFKTKSRIAKLESEIHTLDGIIEKHNKKINDLQNLNKNHEADIRKIQDDVDKKKIRLDKACNDIYNEYQGYIDNVEPLIQDINTDSEDFIPLKKLIGANYEKIVGCYIIHNKEFDKYYVGQSKDVMKRITTGHFNGTKVKNIIFAEDYYRSSFENKDDIFEVKIIRLTTKDELDRTEKELIEEYDAFNSGYNGTSGNS